MFAKKPWKFKPAILLIAISLLTVAFAAGCQQRKLGASGEAASDGRIPVVATIYPLADFAREIGGERVSVAQLLPQGAEPHDWEPSPKELRELYRARLVIYNGAGLEPWMNRLLPSLQSKGIRVMEATKGLQLMTFAEEKKEGCTVFINTSEQFQGEKIVDPHAWLDPVLAQKIVSQLAKELIAVDPAGKVDYLRRAQQLQNRLAELDQAYAAAARSFKRKDIIVSHAAFGYLARRYGLCQIPVLGLTPEQEPDAATLARIVDYCKKSGAKCVFTEPTGNPRIARAVADELGGPVLSLTPIDNLTPEQRANKYDYFDLMLQNLNNLKKALGD